MIKQPTPWLVLVTAIVVGVACGSRATPTTPPQATDIPANAEMDEEESGGAATTEPPGESAPTEAQPATVEVQEAQPEQTPAQAQPEEQQPVGADRPSSPASPDEFRADPGSLVAATGRPQLVEFFTYW